MAQTCDGAPLRGEAEVHRRYQDGARRAQHSGLSGQGVHRRGEGCDIRCLLALHSHTDAPGGLSERRDYVCTGG